MATTHITDRKRFFEISFVLITAIGKFIFMDYLNWRFIFVFTASLLWICYIAYAYKTKKDLFKHWGFRTDNFKSVLLRVLPFGVISIVIFIIIGTIQQTINLTWHIIPILIFYPIWGTVQQFLLIALTAGNLQDYRRIKVNRVIIIFLSALLFAFVHYPIIWLIIGTFILAIFYGWTYLKERNLYVLGLFHGWLAGLFYYTVLNTDPFLNTFGKILH